MDVIKRKILEYRDIMFPKSLSENNLRSVIEHVDIEKLMYFIDSKKRVALAHLVENEPMIEIVLGINELGLTGTFLLWSNILRYSRQKQKGLYTSAFTNSIIAKNSRLKWLMPVQQLVYTTYFFDDIEFGNPPLGEYTILGFEVQFNGFWISITDSCSCVKYNTIRQITKVLKWPLVYVYSSFIFTKTNIELVYRVDINIIRKTIEKMKHRIRLDHIIAYNIPF